MSIPILNIKPEEISNIEKRGQYTIAIIGCRQTGILHACLFAEAGFKITCVDPNQTIVNSITRGRIPFLKRENELKLKSNIKKGLLSATSDIKMTVSQSDAIIIAVPVKTDEKKELNYSDIETVCKNVGSSLRRGSLVVIISTVGVGVMQSLIKETLENNSGYKAGADFGLAYIPIAGLVEPTLEAIANQERIVAAIDKNSLNAASTIFETITKGELRKTEDFKTAEAAALFETVQQDVSLALANELSLFCERTAIDYSEVHKLARKNGNSQLPIPKLTEETAKETHILLEDAENLNLKLRMPAIAREVNEDIVKHAVNLAKDALKTCGKTMRRARISILGISQVPNIKSPPEKKVEQIAKILRDRGAKICFYDPYSMDVEPAEPQYHFAKDLNEALERADCILILQSHEQFKRLNLKRLNVMMRKPAAIIDFEGVLEPDKVEREGLIYRGLGRGVWTK